MQFNSRVFPKLKKIFLNIFDYFLSLLFKDIVQTTILSQNRKWDGRHKLKTRITCSLKVKLNKTGG